jgi:predicted deacylase
LTANPQALPPLEVWPRDIEPYRRGNAGVDYVWRFDSGIPGPRVAVAGLTHGCELCGMTAVTWLLDRGLRPARGALTLWLGNVEAYRRFDPAQLASDHTANRFVDRDFNRCWGDEILDAPGDAVELRRARELRPFVDAADFLLDLHSMHEPCRPIMVCAKSEKSVALSRRIGVPADLLLDTGHPMGLRMIERGAFNDPASPKSAVLIECGQHWEKSAADVAEDTLFRFLAATGAVSASICKSHARVAPPAVQRVVRVTEPVVAKSRNLKFPQSFKGLEVIAKAGTLVATDGDTTWRTPYDDCVLVMPSLAHVRPGATVLRLGRYE